MTRIAWFLPILALAGLLVVSGPAYAPGSPWGWRVQAVEAGNELLAKDVLTVDCLHGCALAWESWGPARLTLTCLDDGETVVWIHPPPADRPRLSHGCIVESTLEIAGAYQSVAWWQGGRCEHPSCRPWPALPSESVFQGSPPPS